MIEDEFNKLLEKEWNNEEKELIKRIMNGMLYYKRFIPNDFKQDILLAIDMCNKLKNELDLKETKNIIEKHDDNVNIIDEEIINIIENENDMEKIYNKMLKIEKEIYELKSIILIDQKSKTNKKYKFYKKIMRKIFQNSP
jgi:hypothetical protein